jgi:hypothetical protein
VHVNAYKPRTNQVLNTADVLTLSKLDSGLFAMTPVDVQLESVARDAVKMFEGEAQSAGVKLEICLEDSCRAVGVETVSLDPTRVLQILINLVTNAIKFTRLEKRRHVTVMLGIALERPHQYAESQVKFVRTSRALEVPSLRADWNQGESVSRCTTHKTSSLIATGICYLRSKRYRPRLDRS